MDVEGLKFILTFISFTGRVHPGQPQYAGQRSTVSTYPFVGINHLLNMHCFWQKHSQYPFPVKRILLTRDPKERVEQGKIKRVSFHSNLSYFFRKRLWNENHWRQIDPKFKRHDWRICFKDPCGRGS